jgi:LysM repeat protein
MLRKFALMIVICFVLLILPRPVLAAEVFHTVKSGDSLWSIAVKYNTSVDKIKQLNQLSTDNLQIGKSLCVVRTQDPQTVAVIDAGAAYYVVQSGDNLWKISQQFNTTVEKIKELNQLSSESLSVGQKLCIAAENPVVEVLPPEPLPAPVVDEEADSASLMENIYIVQPGDSLDGIASAFGTSVAMLKRINNLTSEVINPGYALRLSIAGNEVSRGGYEDRLAAGILATARQHLGTPYRYGGSSPGGFDCSGFVMYVYSQHGYNLNRTAASQYSQGVPVGKADLQPGDLVFFRCYSSSIDHSGIYIGNNDFIHSSSPRSGGVIISSLDESYYARSYAGATRIIQ